MKQYYSYQDISLKPRFSPYRSRSEISVETVLGDHSFNLPVVPANMACTINTELARWMSKNKHFYIMHRFNKNHADAPNTDNKKFIELANAEKWETISISLGVKNEDEELIHYCITNNLRIDYITVDISHGDSIKMKEMLIYLNRMYRSGVCKIARPFIIAGNVATTEAVTNLENWGADAVKCGIAAGKACRTFNETGFGVPMFSCIMECAKVAKKPIIADGGISECGDIAKALVAGATMVMAGGMFAACIDSPAETVVKIVKTHELRENMKMGQRGILENVLDEVLAKRTYKVYFGSASEKNKGANTHIEGTTVELECNKKTYAQKLKELGEGIQSAVSYAGGNLKTVEWSIRYGQKL